MNQNEAFICDYIRTPFGRYGGFLSSIRTDDLAAMPIKSIMARNPSVDWEALDEVILGCANQAGEDNRNIARMASLLAGLPASIPGFTINRLCASGLDAVGSAARIIKSGEASLIIAGGVESMSRSPYVIGKADNSFTRSQGMYDTTLGWRFVNPVMKKTFGVDSMPQTAENVAAEFNISREDQDLFALRSQSRALHAIAQQIIQSEIMPVEIIGKKGDKTTFSLDEHPRETNISKLSVLRPVVNNSGSITAGNASGINDGACSMLIASNQSVKSFNLIPKARIVSMSSSGVEPRLMGIGPISAIQKVLNHTGLNLSDIDIIEINEAFAAQVLAVTRSLGLPDDAEHVNPNGGAIAFGHPLGASGTRILMTAVNQLHTTNGRYALCSMCVGVGQGVAMIIERV